MQGDDRSGDGKKIDADGVQDISLKTERWIKVSGTFLIQSFHLLGLFAIGAATVWAAGLAFLHMVKQGGASIEDLLLLFIYLEIGAMVGIYFRTNRLPVRFIIYVALTAMTRHLIGSMNLDPAHRPDSVPAIEFNTLVLAGAIGLLSVAVLLLRYGSYKFPSENPGYGTDLKADREGSGPRQNRST